MSEITREKFSSQADPEVLDAMRRIAREEGRQLQALIEQALRDFVASREAEKPRKDVVDAFADSVREFDALYRDLAK
ncbi:MAG: hypothetical protein R3212_10195 [Xanthomonadales bacterium]|nr:hypothetical protein [Xanthomonadales bacterium]